MEMYSPKGKHTEPLQVRLSKSEIKDIALQKYTEIAKKIGKEKKCSR